MTIRIWNAFSPNNSSDYRLVARFATPRAARETAAELATFLIDHVGHIRRRWIDSPPADALAERYGFTWTSLMEWSTQIRPGDEPEIAVEDEVLVLYHHYCLGFGDLPGYLQVKGATVQPEEIVAPTISALFRVPHGSARFDAEIAGVLAQIDHSADRRLTPFRTPWPSSATWHHRVAGFRDLDTAGLWFAITPQDLPAFRHWLASHGVDQLVLRWCEDRDEALFAGLAKARCTACGRSLDYLDPRLHDIETPQLVCRPCGGLYDLLAVVGLT
jgi:hypothetical protein